MAVTISTPVTETIVRIIQTSSETVLKKPRLIDVDPYSWRMSDEFRKKEKDWDTNFEVQYLHSSVPYRSSPELAVFDSVDHYWQVTEYQ